MELYLFGLEKQKKKCSNCRKSIELTLVLSVLFKDAQLCQECTQKIQAQKVKQVKKTKPQTENIFDILHQNPFQQLILFLSSYESQSQSIDIIGYQGSLHMSQLQRLTTRAKRIKVFGFRSLLYHHIDQLSFKYPEYKINFKNIIRFQLRGQMLFDIQFLQNLNMPVLQNLSLWDNMITQLKSIKKMSFSQLSEFHITIFIFKYVGHNKIKDMRPLERTYLKGLKKYQQGSNSAILLVIQKLTEDIILKIKRSLSKYVIDYGIDYIEFIEFYDASLKKISLGNCNYSTGRKSL